MSHKNPKPLRVYFDSHPSSSMSAREYDAMERRVLREELKSLVVHPKTRRMLKVLLNNLALAILVLLMFSGCAVVTYNRAFPKLTWYWAHDAKMQRAEQNQNENHN